MRRAVLLPGRDTEENRAEAQRLLQEVAEKQGLRMMPGSIVAEEFERGWVEDDRGPQVGYVATFESEG